MQFKLLQVYKTLSNFSISLIMEFIPFLILGFALPTMGFGKAIAYMFIYWALQSVFRVCFGLLLKKVFYKKPQIFLLLRIIPIICCEICILFLYTNAIWLVLLTAIFSALENTFNDIPANIIYNYVSKDANEKTLGFTTFMDQMGWFVAGIVGGLFLDYIPQYIVVIFSLAMFLGSSIPLFVFYFKFKNTPNFNEDFISYLVAQEEDSQQTKKIKKSFLIKHFITSFLTGPAAYAFYYIVTAIVYIETNSFFLAGIANAIYDGIYGVSSLIIGKTLTKKDGKIAAMLVILYLVGSTCLIYFVRNIYMIYALYWLGAILHPFLNIYIYQTYLDKARILGLGNDILLDRINAQFSAYAICYIMGVFGLLSVTITASVLVLGGVFAIKYNDKSTTKDLVNYLNHNDS